MAQTCRLKQVGRIFINFKNCHIIKQKLAFLVSIYYTNKINTLIFVLSQKWHNLCFYFSNGSKKKKTQHILIPSDFAKYTPHPTRSENSDGNL